MLKQKLKNFLKKIISFEFYEDILVKIFRFFISRNPLSFYFFLRYRIFSKDKENKKIFQEKYQSFNQTHPYLSAGSSFVLIFLMLAGFLFFLFNRNTPQAAAWWNDTWMYRKAVPVTNNTTAENNVYISFSIDTSDSTKFQADCGDLRFTKINGQLLPYYIVSGCGTANTSIHVNFDTLIAGTQTIYYYYGNPSAQNGFSASDFSTQAGSYVVGSLGSEEKSPGPVGYWSFDEGQGTTANDGSGKGNDGTLGNYSKTNPSWQNESSCVSGKCLNFNGDANNGSYVNTGIVEGLAEAADITISAWINQKQLHGDYQSVSSDQWTKYWFGLNLNSQGLSFCIKKTDNNMVCSGTHTMPTSNDWHYVVGVASETSGYVRLYVDGVQVKNVDSSFAIKKTAGNVFIGSVSNGVAGDYFNGFIDEPKIYSYARTADQIKQDYNAGLSGIGTSKGTSVSIGSESDKWMSDGLVGHWKMDEASWGSVIDSSGNGNNGTASGGAMVTAGKFGNGGSFDGTDDYVDIGSGASLNLAGNFSAGAWIKIGEATTYRTIVGWGQHTTNLDRSLWIDSGTGKAALYFFPTSTNQILGTSDLRDNNWHFVFATWDGNRGSIYVDGKLENSGALTAGSFSYAGTKIGQNVSGSYRFIGSLDDVRIYNRALTPSEVEGLYNFAPGPLYHYSLDENIGISSVKDISGNSNNATMTGTWTNSQWVPGKFGSALNFINGNSNYLDTPAFDFLGQSTAQFTVEAWVKPRQIGGTIFHNRNDNTGWSTSLLGYKSGKLNLHIYSGNWLASSNNATANVWTHVAASRDSSGNIKLYENGVLVNSGSGTYSSSGSAQKFTVGRFVADCCQMDSPGWFDGLIDDVRLYNYARTQKQILEDMSAGHPAQKQAVAHWKFDEGYGTTAKDSAGSNDGNLTCTGTTCSNPSWKNDGRIGKALYFFASDNDRSYVTSSPINVASIEGEKITLTMWLKPDALQTGNGWLLRNGVGIDENYGLRLDNSSNGKRRLAMEIYDTNFRTIVSSGFYVPEDQWSYLVVTYSQGQWFKIYIGGVFKEQVDINYGVSVQSGSSFNIGGHSGTTNQYFNGYIDEVKIFNYALTDEEIRQEYSSGGSVSMGGVVGKSDISMGQSSEYCVPGDTATCDPPVAEWKFDEMTGTTANDTSGNNNHGTLTNGPTWEAKGKVGSALSFDGSNDYVSISSALPPSPSQGTVSLWVKRTWETNDNITHGVFCIGEYAPPAHVDYRRLQIFKYGGNNSWYFRLSNESSMNQVIKPDSEISANEWHFVSMSWSGTTVKVYLDGSYLGQFTQGPPSSWLNDKINIGQSYSNGMTKGQIDDVKIYNYARTPAQIAWDYNRGGPVGWWRMDEGEGTTVYDHSGNGNHGTMTNMASDDWVDGKINKALDFDGGDDYVALPQSSSLKITGEITLSGWIKTTNDGGQHTVVSRGYAYMINAPYNNIIEFYGHDGTDSSGCSKSWESSYNDSWVHVATTIRPYTSGWTIRGYVNGVQVCEGTNILFGGSRESGEAIAIGKNGGGTRYFDGQIDDVRIYNYALTAEQVKQVHNNGAVSFK